MVIIVIYGADDWDWTTDLSLTKGQNIYCIKINLTIKYGIIMDYSIIFINIDVPNNMNMMYQIYRNECTS